MIDSLALRKLVSGMRNIRWASTEIITLIRGTEICLMGSQIQLCPDATSPTCWPDKDMPEDVERFYSLYKKFTVSYENYSGDCYCIFYFLEFMFYFSTITTFLFFLYILCVYISLCSVCLHVICATCLRCGYKISLDMEIRQKLCYFIPNLQHS